MFDLLGLGWLPDAPPDFRQRLQSIGETAAAPGSALQQLSTGKLTSTQASQIGRKLAQLRGRGTDLAPLSPFKLAVLSNSTYDLILDALPAAAARHGIALSVTSAPYDQVQQQSFDAASELYASKPDGILVAVDHRWLGLQRFEGDGKRLVDDAIARTESVVAAIQERSSATIIVQTAIGTPLPLFGNLDRRRGTAARAVDRYNERLMVLAENRGLVVLDVATLGEFVGTARLYDPVAWNHFKLPFAKDVIPLYCDWCGRLLAALRGRTRKCLVLDLDNTIWGGVVGDDGLEGLHIGNGSAVGEAHLAVQRLALDLKSRGIILAVCSKNEDATARRPFAEHPEMLLRTGDIAVFQANWIDKASNLEAIAKTLDIGTDALVFLDDNAAERAQVRAALPEVAVPEVGDDPAWYPAILTAAGYFEAVSYTEEDVLRAESYSANAQRAEVMAQSRDLGNYLASLEMRIAHTPFNAINRSRTAQLINKSNQFNLTTRRYTEAQLTGMESADDVITITTRLQDRFGDFGLIGVVIGQRKGEAVEIDTWLMSCRVLGRSVEAATLNELVRLARAAGAGEILASYVPTQKNAMVAEHYDRLGFSRVETLDDGTVRYRYVLDGHVPAPLPFVG
ncbi:MAG TPA: HAD-IIIC family phosphatase [Rhizomicrobium sp.]|nr:HAD-IIIC family phosphatase [Rhizomicrobium sp.]